MLLRGWLCQASPVSWGIKLFSAQDLMELISRQLEINPAGGKHVHAFLSGNYSRVAGKMVGWVW